MHDTAEWVKFTSKSRKIELGNFYQSFKETLHFMNYFISLNFFFFKCVNKDLPNDY